jgi:hypothetical protein
MLGFLAQQGKKVPVPDACFFRFEKKEPGVEDPCKQYTS